MYPLKNWQVHVDFIIIHLGSLTVQNKLIDF